ncbi:MAG: cation diffusion facilitator family transporter [Gammaproteobacteria bacterium]|nr:cation diffusion facilitator family transporter [Gammaproteobacteria bacterium]
MRVTWVGAVVDGVLGLTKMVVGWLFLSQALIADGIHSLSDLLTDFMVLALVRVAGAEADAEHPYGHARFETLGTVFLGLLLLAVAAGLAYQSGARLLAGEAAEAPGWPALAVALLSIAAKEWIFRYTRRVARRLESDLLIANAWHSRSDAWSSLVVFAGVGGAMLGFAWLDSLGAVVVAGFIAAIGWKLSHKALRELVDTAVDPADLRAFTDAALGVEGIRGVHSFKSRRMGSKILLELHLQVAPYLSVSESHHLGDCVMMKLLREFHSIGHIIFHIDTEHDDDPRHAARLPLRAEVTARVDEALQAAGGGMRRGHLALHYLHERIEVELFASGGDLTAAERRALQDELNRRLARFNWFRRITLWYPG